MLIEQRNEKNYQDLLNAVIEKLESSGYEDIKADLQDYESPTKMTRKQDQEEFAPDITATKGGRKHYIEISEKSDKTLKVVGKWRLLSTLSQMKNGAFKLYVPHGSMKFTQDILKNYGITAQVAKI